MPVSHPVAQAQLIDKLYKEVLKKVQSKEPLHKIQELRQLWQNITSSDNLVRANYASQAIITLIKKKILTIPDSINHLVNLSPSCDNLQWTINLVVDILQLQCQLNYQEENSSYNLLTPPHPLISILNVCPQSYPFIFSKFQNLLVSRSTTFNEYSNVLCLFKPLIWFVLVNPTEELIIKTQSQCLFSTLLSPSIILCENMEIRMDIIRFLLQAISAMPMTYENLHLVAQFFGSIMLPIPNTEIYDQVAIQLISLCNISFGSSTMLTFLHLLKGLIEKEVISANLIKVLGLTLSVSLCKSSPNSTESIISTILALLQSKLFQTSPVSLRLICLCNFKVGLLQILLCRNLIGFKDLQPVLKTALNQVNLSLKNCKSDFNHEESEHSVSLSHQYLTHFDSWLTYLNTTFDALYPLFAFKSENTLSKIDQLISVNCNEDAGTILALILSSFIIFSTNYGSDDNVSVAVLSKLVSINGVFPYTALTTLPSLLYSLKAERNPEKQRNLLLCLPKLAQSTDHVGLILKTIQGLDNDSRLQPIVANLLLSLWKTQDRCFPYLMKVFSFKSQSQNSAGLSKELSIIQAVVIREVCRIRPHKYVSEMLPLITNILKSNSHPGIAVYALEALFYLCEDKAVDLMTTWWELKKHFVNSKSTLVTKAVLKLLSLTSLFENESKRYLLFKEEILLWIWKKMINNPNDVIGNALVSLTHFNTNDFKIVHLPEQLQPNNDVPDQDNETFLEQPIPGLSIFNLLQSTNINLKTQMGYFLSYFLSEEIKNLPRDIKDRAVNTTTVSSTSNVTSEISKFILNMYEHNKQPNLKSSFALGLLTCHNPVGECDKDGKVSTKSVVQIGRSFMQILQTLLSEVSVDQKNWLSMTWLVVSWRHFIERCYHAVVESRRAELELQMKQKDTEDVEDIEYKKATVEMWCRDKITDILKAASKGTPTMQGNSILALSGLVVTLKSRKLEKKSQLALPKESTSHLSYEHWKNMACDTLMCIVDQTYKSQGRIFSWCQYRAVSGLGKLTTCLLGKSCAVMAMFNVVLALLPDNTSRVMDMLNLLAKGFSAAGGMTENDETNPVLLVNYGVSIGKIISYVYSKKINTADSGVMENSIKRCVDIMKKCAFDHREKDGEFDEDFGDEESKEDTVGAIIGIGILLPSLLTSGNRIVRAGANEILSQLQNLLTDSCDYSETYRDSVLMAVTQCSDQDFDNAFESTKKKMLKNPNSVLLSQRFASMCYSLLSRNGEAALESYNAVFDTWIEQVSNLKLPTRQRLAAIGGLDYLFGTECCLTAMETSFKHPEKNVKKLIKVCQGLIRKKEILTKSCVALLSRVYILSQTSKGEVKSKYPSTYSYLPKTSVLRHSFVCIVNWKNENEDFFRLNLECVSVCASQYKNLFPPVNWCLILTQIIEEYKNEKVVDYCFCIILSQMGNDPMVSLLLSNWIQKNKFNSLPLPTRIQIELHMDKLIQSLADTKIISFLEHSLSLAVQNQNSDLTKSILSGILSGLAMQDLTEDISAKLFSVTNEIFLLYKLDLSDNKGIENCLLVTKCLAEHPHIGSILPDVTSNMADGILLKVFFVKCYLLSLGKVRLSSLNECLQETSNRNEATQKQVLQILRACLRAMKMSTSPDCNATKCMEWLQEIMAMAIALQSSLFIFKVVVLVVLMSINTGVNQSIEGITNEYEWDFTLERLLDLFPSALNQLLLQTPWNSHFATHTVQWLIKFNSKTVTENSIHNCIEQALVQLKDHSAYKQSSIWKSVVTHLYL